MRRWPQSVRGRLTLWYSLGLGAMLAVGAVGSWYMLQRVLATRGDRFLVEARDAFVVELHVERTMTRANDAAVAAALRDIRFSDIEFVVLDEGRHVVGASELARPGDVERALVGAGSPADGLLTIPGRAGGWRAAVVETSLGGVPHVVAAVQARRWLHDTLTAVTAAYLAAIPLLLGVAAAGGYLLARRALAPVAAMGRRTHAIEAANLHERLPVEHPRDELGELATVINALLARLEDAFAQQRRLVADASHELGTPLAVIRAEAEIALARPTRAEDEYRAALGVVREAGERLSRVVDDLLFLARADGGPVPLRRVPVELDEIVEETAEVVRSLARRRDVRLDVESASEAAGDAACIGDPELLGRLVLNLLDNAIKYSPPGGAVRARCRRDGDAVVLDVSDCGPGIPAAAHERVFDRFFRLDGARARADGAAAGGTGLGLAIARWIATAHGGTLVVARSTPRGSTFRLALPAADATRAAPVAS